MTEEIKIYKKIEAKRPVMIAGWPGMGNVALGVVDYLRRKLPVVKFAEIPVDPLITLDSVVVENGIARMAELPRNTFYYNPKPELIIFEGEAQLPAPHGVGVLKKVLGVAVDLKVRRIFTGAAFPFPVSYKDVPKVYGAVSDKPLADALTGFGIRRMNSGHISGLNGLMLGLAKQGNIEAICLLATMPQYAISLPNPKASKAIVEKLGKMLDFSVNLKELNEYIIDMDEQMAVIEEKVKDVLTIEKAEPEAHPSEKKIPGYVMERIEKLFHDARTDKSKAIILKRELDRWDLYKLYEDRFLDLFKESQ